MGCTILNGWKKLKGRLFHDNLRIRYKIQVSMSINNVLLKHSLHRIVLIELSNCERIHGQQSLKYLLSDPLQKKKKFYNTYWKNVDCLYFHALGERIALSNTSSPAPPYAANLVSVCSLCMLIQALLQEHEFVSSAHQSCSPK